MRYLIPAGSGLLGKHFTGFLLQDPNNHVTILSRSPGNQSSGRVTHKVWDGKNIPIDTGNFDVILNLAGISIGEKRWTPSFKKEIIESRLKPALACVEFIKNCESKPRIMLASSGIGYFGGTRAEEVDESSTAGNDYLADVCRQWEDAYRGCAVRTVFLRTAVVLTKDSPSMQLMMLPYQLFAGGRVASGMQHIPWIHIADWIRAVEFIIADETISGPVILSSTEQATQNQFGKILGKAMKRPHWTIIPKALLQLGMGEKSILAWGNMQARPGVLSERGFQWEYPSLEEAVEEMLHGSGTK